MEFVGSIIQKVFVPSQLLDTSPLERKAEIKATDWIGRGKKQLRKCRVVVRWVGGSWDTVHMWKGWP